MAAAWGRAALLRTALGRAASLGHQCQETSFKNLVLRHEFQETYPAGRRRGGRAALLRTAMGRAASLGHHFQEASFKKLGLRT